MTTGKCRLESGRTLKFQMNAELKETLTELAVLNERRHAAHEDYVGSTENYAATACAFREAALFGLRELNDSQIERVSVALNEKLEGIEDAILDLGVHKKKDQE